LRFHILYSLQNLADIILSDTVVNLLVRREEYEVLADMSKDGMIKQNWCESVACLVPGDGKIGVTRRKPMQSDSYFVTHDQSVALCHVRRWSRLARLCIYTR